MIAPPGESSRHQSEGWADMAAAVVHFLQLEGEVTSLSNFVFEKTLSRTSSFLLLVGCWLLAGSLLAFLLFQDFCPCFVVSCFWLVDSLLVFSRLQGILFQVLSCWERGC